MSQAVRSYINEDNEETKAFGSQLSATGGSVPIPLEALRPYANQTLIEEVELLKKMLTEAQQKIKEDDKTINDQKSAMGDMSLELFRIKRENERLYKEIEESGHSSTQNNDFIYSIDCRNYRNKDKEMASKEWVINFWNNMYIFIETTNEEGKYIVNCAEDIVPIYKTLTESVTIEYNYTGKREDFEYEWNTNIVERIENPTRAKKLTCKHKTFNSALSQPCWKGIKPSNWKNLSLEGGTYEKKYEKGNLIKQGIERFAR